MLAFIAQGLDENIVRGRFRVVAISWEPSELDSIYVVSGSLSVVTETGDKVLGYPKHVSVSAGNQREAKTKVRMMLLSRRGLKDTQVKEDALSAVLRED